MARMKPTSVGRFSSRADRLRCLSRTAAASSPAAAKDASVHFGSRCRAVAMRGSLLGTAVSTRSSIPPPNSRHAGPVQAPRSLGIGPRVSLLSAMARPMLGGVFIYGGLDSIRRPQSKVSAAEKVVGDVSEVVGDDVDPTQLVRVNGAVQVG